MASLVQVEARGKRGRMDRVAQLGVLVYDQICGSEPVPTNSPRRQYRRLASFHSRSTTPWQPVCTRWVSVDSRPCSTYWFAMLGFVLATLSRSSDSTPGLRPSTLYEPERQFKVVSIMPATRRATVSDASWACLEQECNGSRSRFSAVSSLLGETPRPHRGSRVRDSVYCEIRNRPRLLG